MRVLCADVTGGKACTQWFRIGTNIEYVSNSILGKEDPFSKHHSLIFKFVFTCSAYSNRYQFAQNYPYTFSHLQEYLNYFVFRHKNSIQIIHRVLTSTICKNDVDLLQITQKPTCRRPVILVTARIHPGESQSSFLVEGFINFILDEVDPIAK